MRPPITAGLLLAVIFLAGIIALAGMGQEWLIAALHQAESAIRGHFIAGLIVFIGAFVVLATLTLPVGTLFCLAGGYLFGIPIGALASLAGACISAGLTFVLARRLGGEPVLVRLSTGRTETWLRALERDAPWYLVLLRIVPVAPFFVVNAAAAIIGIRFSHYMLTTATGLIPVTVIYASVGAGLNSMLDAGRMLSPGLLLKPEIGLPLAALAALVMASWLIRRRLLQRL